MSAGLLKPSVADEDKTDTKLRLRQQLHARYEGVLANRDDDGNVLNKRLNEQNNGFARAL